MQVNRLTPRLGEAPLVQTVRTTSLLTSSTGSLSPSLERGSARCPCASSVWPSNSLLAGGVERWRCRRGCGAGSIWTDPFGAPPSELCLDVFEPKESPPRWRVLAAPLPLIGPPLPPPPPLPSLLFLDCSRRSLCLSAFCVCLSSYGITIPGKSAVI